MAISDATIQWWRDAKFGMFIHWGLYAVPAGEWKGWKTDFIGEWIMHTGQIPVKEYEKLAEQFNPVQFNAKEWVNLAKETGMKYLTITAKHHDGFAMYKSHCSPYNIVDATPYKKDPMADLAEECRKAGIKLCFYYSQVQDWHEKDAVGNTWDWPNENEKDFKKYLDEKGKPQLKEILTQYGDIGLIWFDTPLNVEKKYSQELYDYVKQLQPNCLVSGRIGNQLGDYISTGDNLIPSLPIKRDWEVPATLNDTWGYKYFDDNWKDPEKLLRLLVTINGRGGNYLLNVGPTAEGIIPKPSVNILNTVGEWMKENGESIYGTRPAPLFPYDYSEWAGVTYKPGKLFFHIFTWSEQVLHLHTIRNKIKRIYLLNEPEKDLDFEHYYMSSLNQHRLKISAPEKRPHPIDSVVVMEFEDDKIEFDSLEDL